MKTWSVRGIWLALAIAAGLTTWLLLANRAPSVRPSSAAAGRQPDYRLSDAEITRYASDGRRQSVLHAASVEHMPVSGDSRLTAIELHYYPRAQAWRLRAARGVLSNDGNRLALTGSVRAREVDVADPVHFAAPHVVVFLSTHQIRSDARVTLWRGAQVTTGVGLLADLHAGTVSLLKNVTSRYVQ